MSEQDLQSVPNLSETSDKVTELLEEVEVSKVEPENKEEGVFEELGISPLEILKYIFLFIILIAFFVYGSLKVFPVNWL